MPKLIDLTGQRFGWLTVVERAGSSKDGEALWLCRCVCGQTRIVFGSRLRRGKTVSCGCYSRTVTSARVKTHGKTNSRLFRIWTGMKNRCYNPRSTDYERYGGRGVVVCDEWRNDFQTFYVWAMSSGYEPQLSIDRKNNDGPYSPNNCRWSTETEQSRNRRSNRNIAFNGKTKTLAEWAAEYGILFVTLQSRLDRGWSIERALTEPVKKNKK